jgi:hypothetical protein
MKNKAFKAYVLLFFGLSLRHEAFCKQHLTNDLDELPIGRPAPTTQYVSIKACNGSQTKDSVSSDGAETINSQLSKKGEYFFASYGPRPGNVLRLKSGYAMGEKGEYLWFCSMEGDLAYDIRVAQDFRNYYADAKHSKGKDQRFAKAVSNMLATFPYDTYIYRSHADPTRKRMPVGCTQQFEKWLEERKSEGLATTMKDFCSALPSAIMRNFVPIENSTSAQKNRNIFGNSECMLAQQTSDNPDNPASKKRIEILDLARLAGRSLAYVLDFNKRNPELIRMDTLPVATLQARNLPNCAKCHGADDPKTEVPSYKNLHGLWVDAPYPTPPPGALVQTGGISLGLKWDRLKRWAESAETDPCAQFAEVEIGTKAPQIFSRKGVGTQGIDPYIAIGQNLEKGFASKLYQTISKNKWFDALAPALVGLDYPVYCNGTPIGPEMEEKIANLYKTYHGELASTFPAVKNAPTMVWELLGIDARRIFQWGKRNKDVTEPNEDFFSFNTGLKWVAGAVRLMAMQNLKKQFPVLAQSFSSHSNREAKKLYEALTAKESNDFDLAASIQKLTSDDAILLTPGIRTPEQWKKAKMRPPSEAELKRGNEKALALCKKLNSLIPDKLPEMQQ